jgi:hypothetical protein
MNIPERKEDLELLVVRYLYGDLTESERAEVEAAAGDNSMLKELLEEEQRLDRSIPLGTAPYIDNVRQEENRRLLRRNLQKQVADQSALSNFLVSMLRKPSLVAFQSIALIASYFLGSFIAGPGEISPNSNAPAFATLSPLSLINEEDYEISQMRINEFDPSSGAIDLSFSLISESQLSGNVADAGVRTLMTVALLNEIDATARLDTLDALQNAAYDSDLSDSMIHVLSSDNNPGVRYSAVKSLVNYAENDTVRSALLAALNQDVNPGVRIEAFNALAQNPDAETLAIFRQIMSNDSNSYIRDTARSIVEDSEINNAQSDIF